MHSDHNDASELIGVSTRAVVEGIATVRSGYRCACAPSAGETCKKQHDNDDVKYLQARAMLMAEGALLAQLGHPNIVGLIGVVSKHQQAMLVMEMCANGSLYAFLRV